MSESVTDTTDMLAVHDGLRVEFSRLPGAVAATADGDGERAAVVGGHVLFMCDFLDAHHTSEDAIVWPLLKERSPEHGALVGTMEGQHEAMHAVLGATRAQAQAWIAAPGGDERDSLVSTLVELDRQLVEHLAREEEDVLPLISRDLSLEEWVSVGEHSRATFSPETLTIALGIILDNTTPERGERILAEMPPEARAGFEEFGRPAFAAYRERLAIT